MSKFHTTLHLFSRTSSHLLDDVRPLFLKWFLQRPSSVPPWSTHCPFTTRPPKMTYETKENAKLSTFAEWISFFRWLLLSVVHSWCLLDDETSPWYFFNRSCSTPETDEERESLVWQGEFTLIHYNCFFFLTFFLLSWEGISEKERRDFRGHERQKDFWKFTWHCTVGCWFLIRSLKTRHHDNFIMFSLTMTV